MATAPIARVTSVVGHTRSSISVLSAATSSAQPPTAPGHAHALLELAFLADHAAHARGLVGAALADGEDLVEDVGDLALDAEQVGRHARAEVAVLEAQERREQVAREGLRPHSRVVASEQDPGLDHILGRGRGIDRIGHKQLPSRRYHANA